MYSAEARKESRVAHGLTRFSGYHPRTYLQTASHAARSTFTDHVLCRGQEGIAWCPRVNPILGSSPTGVSTDSLARSQEYFFVSVKNGLTRV